MPMQLTPFRKSHAERMLLKMKTAMQKTIKVLFGLRFQVLYESDH